MVTDTKTEGVWDSKVVFTSLDFLISTPGAAMEPAILMRMQECIQCQKYKEHGIALSTVSGIKLVINLCLQGV